MLWRAPVRFLTDSYHINEVRRTAVKSLGPSLTFTTSKDSGRLQYEEQWGTRSVQVQIVDALRSGEREKASRLLYNFVNEPNHLRPDDFIYIYGYCARSPDPLFVMETYKVMEDKDIGMNRKCYRFIVQALAKGGYLEEAFNWLTYLGRNQSTSPDLPMYNSFLNGCIAAGSPLEAEKCLELMEDRLIGKSEITYWELLKLAVWQQNLIGVHKIWKKCMEFYNPSIICLRKFIWCFTRMGDLESAYGALQQMVFVALKQSSLVKVSSGGRYQSSQLDIPIPSKNEFILSMRTEDRSVKFREEIGGNHEDMCTGDSMVIFSTEDVVRYERHFVDTPPEARMGRPSDGVGTVYPSLQSYSSGRVKKEGSSDCGLMEVKLQYTGFNSLLNKSVPVPVMKFLRWSFSDVIHACAHSNKCELAEQLFLQMQSIGLEPSQHTYDGFVKAVVRVKGASYGLEVVRAMENRNLKPYNATLATLSVGCSEVLKLDLAESLLDEIDEDHSKYIYAFNALLCACDVMDEPERAVRVLAKMKRLNVKSDVRTYELLFSLFGTVNAPYEYGSLLSKADANKRILAIEMDMDKHGVRHTQTSIENLLKAFGAEGMMSEMFLRLEKNLFSHTNRISMYNIALHALVEAKEIRRALLIFKDMKLCGLSPDAVTYNIMIDCCSTLRCYKSASAFVSMMLREGFSAGTLTYTALLKILAASGDFDAALYLLDKALSEGVQPDVLMFNTILKKACPKGRIDILESIIKRMHQEKIQPDPSTCAHAFYAYVKQGFLSTAMEALQVLSLRMVSPDEGGLEDKKVSFEDLILDEDPDTESRIVDIFKGSGEHLAAALLNLRWCAMNGHSVSWVPSRSTWARSLSIC